MRAIFDWNLKEIVKGTVSKISCDPSCKDGIRKTVMINNVKDIVVFLDLKVFIDFDNSYMFSCSRKAQVNLLKKNIVENNQFSKL